MFLFFVDRKLDKLAEKEKGGKVKKKKKEKKKKHKKVRDLGNKPTFFLLSVFLWPA